MRQIYPSIAYLSIYCLSIYLSIDRSIYCLSICLSIDQLIYLSIYLSIYHLSIYLLSIYRLSMYPSIAYLSIYCLSTVYLSIYPSIAYLSIYCLSIYHLSIYLSIYLPIHPWSEWVCVWEREGERKRERDFGDTTLLALKMEEGALSPGMSAVSRSWKRQGMESPLEPPEGSQPCWPLDFSPCKTHLGRWPPDL